MSTSTQQVTVRTEPADGVAETDAELIRAVRSGDMDAAGSLYCRHCGAALRAARAIGGQGMAEDLVAEAFTRVLTSIHAGGGPDHGFRPYLVTTIRHLFIDAVRRSSREVLVGEAPERVDVVQSDDTDALVDQSVMFEVLAVLPARWREILWRTIVLDEPLTVAGAAMGLNANAAAALGFRARAGLCKAYRQRVSPTLSPGGPADARPSVRTA